MALCHPLLLGSAGSVGPCRASLLRSLTLARALGAAAASRFCAATRCARVAGQLAVFDGAPRFSAWWLPAPVHQERTVAYFFYFSPPGAARPLRKSGRLPTCVRRGTLRGPAGGVNSILITTSKNHHHLEVNLGLYRRKRPPNRPPALSAVVRPPLRFALARSRRPAWRRDRHPSLPLRARPPTAA